MKLEDIEVTVADHTQKVMKPNFAAAWEEIGEGNELEETFTLSSMKTLDGMYLLQHFSLLLIQSCPDIPPISVRHSILARDRGGDNEGKSIKYILPTCL